MLIHVHRKCQLSVKNENDSIRLARRVYVTVTVIQVNIAAKELLLERYLIRLIRRMAEIIAQTSSSKPVCPSPALPCEAQNVNTQTHQPSQLLLPLPLNVTDIKRKGSMLGSCWVWKKLLGKTEIFTSQRSSQDTLFLSCLFDPPRQTAAAAVSEAVRYPLLHWGTFPLSDSDSS